MSGEPLNDRDDVLAAELALRVLSPVDEAEARERARREPAFADGVARWDDRLGGLLSEVEPVAPSAGLWPRIEGAAYGANDNDRVAFWRTWAMGATGLLAASVAGLAILAVQPPPPAAPAQPPAMAVTRVATLELEGGAAAMTLVYDSVTGRLYLAPTDRMAGDERVPHLWLVMPEGGVQLVGAIDGLSTSQRSLDAAMSGMAGEATAVAVSMEQPGHTPGAHRPDGPVVASGQLKQL